jgi:hypothetical protein
MLKNIIITILGLFIVVFWLKEEPEDMVSDDPNDVTIEYKCNELDTYESVPVEVIEECKSRGFAVRDTI